MRENKSNNKELSLISNFAVWLDDFKGLFHLKGFYDLEMMTAITSCGQWHTPYNFSNPVISTELLVLLLDKILATVS